VRKDKIYAWLNYLGDVKMGGGPSSSVASETSEDKCTGMKKSECLDYRRNW
jgi:hypothetical protein